ncbi:MAG: class I SAM-dependent methyltransferase [Eubacteriales bacterium]|nr:class I SAM-dependent methyltransferase [Eubacteriales bacterium]
MQLSERLSAIADMVTSGNYLVDVGCDHGYLPIDLARSGKVPSAIAMDVRPGPLAHAKENIAAHQLCDRIETRLSDGLEKLEKSDMISNQGAKWTLVIAGMGGPLMERILEDGKNVREYFSEMILQPQSDIPHFRTYIRSAGWEIVEEKMIFEDGKYYPMMKVMKADVSSMPEYTPEEGYGKLLLEQKHPVLKQYLEREWKIHEKIVDQLQKQDTETAKSRLGEVEHEMTVIRKALERF